MNSVDYEDSKSRKKEPPHSLQSDQEFEENTMKVSFPLSKHEDAIGRKIETRSLQSDEAYENTMKVAFSQHVQHEDDVSRKIEPQSLPPHQTVEENSMKVSFSQHEDHISKKREPTLLHSGQTFEKNTMKMRSHKEEDIMSRKVEPRLFQSDKASEESSMKMHTLSDESHISRREEPKSYQIPEENTMKIHTANQEENMSRKINPQSHQNPEENTMKMFSVANEGSMSKKVKAQAPHPYNVQHLQINETVIEAGQEEEEVKGPSENSGRGKSDAPLRQSYQEETYPSPSYLKLEDAMTKLSQTHAKDYTVSSHLIMQQLHEKPDNGGDSFLKWVRFLDVTAHKYEDFQANDEDDREIFIHQMEELVLQILLVDHLDTITTAAIDWRIAKKLLSLPSLFPRISPTIDDNGILTSVGNEVNKALAQIIWLPTTILSKLAKENLRKLQELFRDKSCHENLKQAVIVGRFDKREFGLSNSLILGEDGGLYLLLNRLTKEQQDSMVNQNIVTEDYLRDKIIKSPEGDQDKNGDKIVLGKGGFGTVSFALSLFRSKSDCGNVICIKKTRNFVALASRKRQDTLTPLQIATDVIMEDYFASEFADKVYAPKIFDLALVSDPLVNKERDLSIKRCHRRGYLMMEVFPQNTAAKIFLDSEYQKWQYQKPYLQEVLLATSELLKNGIAFTDLKPANTLFDPETLKTTIIDLGGSIKLDAGSLEMFDKTKFSCQLTKGYCAPEMIDDKKMTVSISKALAYTCGKVMEKVVNSSEDKNIQELRALARRLTHQEPDQRLTIEEALQCLKEIGHDADTEDLLLKQYVSKIKSCIEHNRSSISLNEDILITKELYIDLNVTLRNPEKYKDQEAESLFERINCFLAEEQDQQQVMAIFGSAGSGKSISLQLKFIEAAQKWSKGRPLPIYFNLANGIDLIRIIDSMNAELGTNLKLQELKNDVHLYVDSFDEGLEIEKKRETLIRDYLAELKNSRAKILITCRSDYLESDRSYNWFTPQNAQKKLTYFYVVPLSYIGVKKIVENDSHAEEKKENELRKEDNAGGSSWKKHVVTYLEHNNKNKDSQVNIEEILEKMAIMNLDKLMETGLMFHIIMEVLHELLGDETQSRSRRKHDIYLKYVIKYQNKEQRKLTEEQKAQVTECTKFISGTQKKEFTLIKTISDLGKYLAVQLHLHDKFRLEQDTPIFQALGYEDQIHFKKQALWHTLKLLPLKIETKQSNNPNKIKSQEVKLGFMHDTIKNSYLIDAILDEMSAHNGKSQILASKNIVADMELVKYIADAAQHDSVLRTHLRKAIDLTKSDKSESAAICAANCITILVSAHYSFSSQDLSNINIKGSNLSNGIFHGTDFTGADLSYANIRNIQVNGARFRKANLLNVQLSILPDLQGHTSVVTGVSFSSDGKYVVSGSWDQTVKIWEVQTNKCLTTLKGHTSVVTGVSFSSDGKYVVSGSFDKTVKIWEVQTNECLTTLQGHTDRVTSVSFSSDGKYVVSGSEDMRVKIWEVQTNKCLNIGFHTYFVTSVSFSSDGKYVVSGSQDGRVNIWEVKTNECLTLKGHTSYVNGASFSSDGKYVVSGSCDQTVKIWEVQTNKCLTTLQGHTAQVTSVSFSSDGKYVVSGSSDKTVKIWEVQTNKCLTTLKGHTDQVNSVSFSSDGKYVVSGSSDKAVKIWDFSDSTNNLIERESHTRGLYGVSFSSDGKYVVSGSADQTVKIWEVQTNKCLTTLKGHTDQVNSVSFSSDGKYVVSGSWDQTVKIWEVQTNKCLTTLKGHGLNTLKDHKMDGLLFFGVNFGVNFGRVNGVNFSSDGKYVVSGSQDVTVKIWEVKTNKCLTTLQGHTAQVTSVSFSSDGKYVVSGSEDKTVKIWKVQSNKCLTTLQGHTDQVTSVSFSSDGKYVVSGSEDETVKIWEVKTNKCLTTLQGHTAQVTSVSFSSDGKYVVSGSFDKTVKIWEVQTNKCLTTLQGHTDQVTSVSFSSDGKYVVSGSEDKTVKIWLKINNSWMLERHLSDSGFALQMQGTVIEGTVISARNQLIFDLNGAKIKTNKIADNTAIKTESPSTLALYIAEKLNEQLLAMQIATYKELARQNAMQVHFLTLLKQTEQNKKNKNEALKHQIISDKETAVVNQSQSADHSFGHSSLIEVKSHNGKLQVSLQHSIEKVQVSQPQSGNKKNLPFFSNRVYKAYGHSLRKQRHNEEAIQAYDIGLCVLSEEASPNSNDKAALLNDKGLTLLASSNQFDEAIKCFDQAIEAVPVNALYHCNKGQALYEKNPKDIAFLSCFDEAFKLTQKESLQGERVTRSPIQFINKTLSRFVKELNDLRAIKLAKESLIIAERELNYVKETMAGLRDVKVVRDGQQIIDTKNKLAKVLEDDPDLSEFYDGFLSILCQSYCTAVIVHRGIFRINTVHSTEDDAKLLVSLIPLVGNLIFEGAGQVHNYVETDQVKMSAGNFTKFATNLQEFSAIAQDAAVEIITAKQDEIISLKGKIPHMMTAWKSQFEKVFDRSKQIEKYLYDNRLETPMQKLGYQIAADLVAKFIANGKLYEEKSVNSLSQNLEKKIQGLTNAGLFLLNQEIENISASTDCNQEIENIPTSTDCNQEIENIPTSTVCYCQIF